MTTQPDLFKQTTTQILDQIHNLQTTEQTLINDYSNTNYNSQTKATIIRQINSLSNTRMQLYKTLSGIKTYFDVSAFESKKTIFSQKLAIQAMESELNSIKERYNSYLAEKEIQMQLIQENQYNAEVYDKKTELIKLFLYTIIPLFFVIIAYKMQFITTMVYIGLTIIIIIIGGAFVIKQAISINNIDESNYQYTDWGPVNVVS